MHHRRRPSRSIGTSTSFIVLILLAVACSKPQPTFEKIGVLEGFYGKPWTHQARLDMIRFMGDAGFTHYIYAPKDDPYHRSRWRDPYPRAKLREFRQLSKVADSAGITLVFAISPGLNIVYSDSIDVSVLREKVQTMTQHGFKEMALFLDDVPEHLQHEADIKRFKNLAEAHVHLVESIREGFELMVCPTTYTSAWGDQEYVSTLSRGIGEDIPMFWTGRDVAPATITLAETRLQRLRLKGQLYLWDNFPVNDFETWRPLVGPLKGRSPELAKMVSGYFANPMESVYLSMIPLHTVAQYARNPSTYDPKKALENAIQSVFTSTYADSIRPFIQLYSAPGWEDQLFSGIYTPGVAIDTFAVDSTLATFTLNPDSLRGWERAFVKDYIPYIEKTRSDWLLMKKTDQPNPIIRSGDEIRFRQGYWILNERTDSLSFTLKLTGRATASEWIVVVTETGEPRRRWLTPKDQIYKVDLKGGSVESGHLLLTEFSQRGISDIRLNRITSFFNTFWMADTLVSATYSNGVLTVPRPQSELFRVNISIPGVYQAAEPAMLGNPWTFPIFEP